MNILSENELKKYFWKKKEIISFFLSLLVLLIHVSSFSQYEITHSVISVFNEKAAYFLKESITRYAVPMFFLLSGVAFFRDYSNKNYFKKVKSRVHSLLIPYLLWNTLWLIFELICSYTFISSFFIGRQKVELSFINILKGIFFYQSNLQFWFVFNLMVFVLISPLIELLIRNKYIGITSVILLSVLQIFDIGLPASLFFDSSSIVFYLIGAIIGKHYFHFVLRKSSVPIRILSCIFFVAIIILKNIYGTPEYTVQPLVKIIVLTFCSYFVWNIFDIFIDKIKYRPLYTRSFAIYAMHVNVASVVTKLIYLIFPDYEWLALPNFILTCIITVAVINFTCVIMQRYLPSIYAVFFGQRLHAKT